MWGNVGAGIKGNQKREKGYHWLGNQRHTLEGLGNGRNTVSRVLFRKREFTEFWGKLGEFCTKLGEFGTKTRWVRFGTQLIGWEELTEFRSPELSEPQKKNWVRCLKPFSPKPYSARFRRLVWPPLQIVALNLLFGANFGRWAIFEKCRWPIPRNRVNRSCTRLRVPPVALHVLRYTCRSWFPGFQRVLQV